MRLEKIVYHFPWLPSSRPARTWGSRLSKLCPILHGQHPWTHQSLQRQSREAVPFFHNWPHQGQAVPGQGNCSPSSAAGLPMPGQTLGYQVRKAAPPLPWPITLRPMVPAWESCACSSIGGLLQGKRGPGMTGWGCSIPNSMASLPRTDQALGPRSRMLHPLFCSWHSQHQPLHGVSDWGRLCSLFHGSPL